MELADSSSLVASSRATRTSTRKVRTGCTTCKKRHIKCDETKPSCSNCLKSRRHCEGYVQEPRKKRGAVKSSVLQIRRVPGASWASDTWPAAQMLLDAEHHDFFDETSHLYFREFVALMQNDWLTGFSNTQSHLWEETMPQICRGNRILRYGAMALGAMSLWRQTCFLEAKRPSSQAALADSHHIHALMCYGEALKLQGGSHASFQSAMVLSVLLLLFESLRHQHQAALDHVNHGMALLLSHLTGPTAANSICGFSPNPRPVLAQLADVYVHLSAQTRLVLRGRVGKACPLPDLSKGLQSKGMSMEAFVLLLSQVTKRRPFHVPRDFVSLSEFEEHWISLIRRQAEMGPIMLKAMHESRILESGDQEQIISTFLLLLRDPQVRAFCRETRAELEMVERAFMPLYTRVTMSTDIGSPLYTRARHLRLQYLVIRIFNNPPQYANVDEMIALGPMFRELVSLAQFLIRNYTLGVANPAHHICLDGGLAWHLFLTAFHCRDQLTRDEAILLLRGYPGQDGLWKTRALYALAMKNRVLEFANDNDDPAQVQWRRLWRREYYLEDGGDRLVFRFLEKDEGSRKWVLAEELGEFQQDGDDDVEWLRRTRPGKGNLLAREATPDSA